MPNTVQDANILQSGQARIFIQDAGVSPANAYKYYGCTQLEKTAQDQGKVEPIYCPDPNNRNKFIIVGMIKKAKALGKTGFTTHADRLMQDVWWSLKNKGCSFNVQAVIGACQNPSVFTQWDSKLYLSNAVLENLGINELNVLDGDKNIAVDLTGDLSFQDWDVIRPLVFTEHGDVTIVAEVLDGLFYDTVTCGDCGPASDGCQKFYCLTLANAGSPGLSSQIVHSTDGGKTLAAVDIPTLGGLSGNRMAGMGDKLVVVSQAKGNHQWAYAADIDAGLANWNAISTGYVSTKGPRCLTVRNANEAFIGAAGGYIYLLSDPTVSPTVLTDGSVTTQDVNDIHSFGRTVVAVANNNAMLVSNNEGASFGLVTGPAVGINLTSVWLQGKTAWFVGTGDGRLFYTLDGGNSWTQITIPGGANVVNDLNFYDSTVGYMSVEVNGVAKVFRTTDSGNSWQNNAPSLDKFPSTWARINAVFACGANIVAAMGRKTAGGDGALAIAQ